MIATDTSQTIRLFQISDTHCYADDDAALTWSPLPVQPNRSLQRLLSHLNNSATAHRALMISGDLVQEETAASYERLSQLLADCTLPIYALPGNHDQPHLMQQAFQAYEHIHYLEPVRFGLWHCLFIDTSWPNSDDGYLDASRLQLLRQQLDQLPAESHAIIFMHHHPIPIGSPWMDNHGLQQPGPFWGLVNEYAQVKAIAFGHIHHAFTGKYRADHGGSVAIYGTPATCVQLGHDSTKITFENTRPAWREWQLYPDGRLQSEVYYLPEL